MATDMAPSPSRRSDADGRQWLVAYVKSCMEKKTAERLRAMGIECYLPVQSVIRQWSDRRKRRSVRCPSRWPPSRATWCCAASTSLPSSPMSR